MEQNQIPIPPSSEAPHFINQPAKKGYFTRLFTGRLNRQNYIWGSTFFVLLPLLCFMIVLFNILTSADTFAMSYLDPNNPGNIITPQVSIVSLLQTPKNEAWLTIGIVFIILSLPYLLSLQIRRLHDLSLSGWLWIVNFLPLFFIKSMYSLAALTHPDMWFWLGNFVSLITGCFSIYVSVWPGTKETNKYGEKPLPRSSLLGDILEITA